MENRFRHRVPIPGTDLTVPVACVGTMMFGKRADEAESRCMVDTALEHGINFFDTADAYQAGESERLLGRALRGRRDQCIVATKVGYGSNADGKEEGLSRHAILRALERSLKNLDTDYVDVYYLHRPDSNVPIAESLMTMGELVRAGRVRHIGISNFSAWQTYDILQLCARNGWPRPMLTQMLYNLLVRQLDYEYVHLCGEHGLHLTAYNPLAGGLLTGKYTALKDNSSGYRFRDNTMYSKRYWSRRFMQATRSLARIAADCSMSLTHLALNWMLQESKMDSILLGPSSAAQLNDCLAAGTTMIPEQGLDRIRAFLVGFDGTDACYAR